VTSSQRGIFQPINCGWRGIAWKGQVILRAVFQRAEKVRELCLRLERPGLVVHICNPSYSRDKDWEDHSLKPAPAKI
jgi:hypothetical protein